jgi:uncharacterized protein (TIGR03086 family)
MAGLVSCDRDAVLASVAVVAQVQVGDLDRPTPCAGWTLGKLLAHMIGQHYGFAAAAEGNSHDVAVFADRPVGASPAADYEAAAHRVISAFALPSVIAGEMYLPEVRNGITVPAPVAIGFHLVDYVVHGWDVARSLGVAIEFEADVLARALSVAESVPHEAKSLDPRAPFRPGLATASADPLDRILALLGRAPDWTAGGTP